ncbi:hypothetical protein PG994_012819 [Apiospora phragmitis]|uniref:Cyanovirin-N domain-containing protein n=1 Tax=Apiospora phragmitis TaxID=2905665 RepID=A0ABR1T8I9_9PEZI
MVLRPLYEPDMAPPYPSDSTSQRGGQSSENYNSPLPQLPANPNASPRARPTSLDSPSEGRAAGYPYSPDQLSYPSYVRGHSYQQPAPAPVPSPYLYTGQYSPGYGAQQYPQQYPQQPTYAESPKPPTQPPYSPQPPHSPQPQYPSSQPAFFPPAQPQYATPPAPPPYSSSSIYGDAPGDVKHEYPGPPCHRPLMTSAAVRPAPLPGTSTRRYPNLLHPPLHPRQSPNHPSSATSPHSSSRISLDRDYDLIAECRTIGGHQKLASISLNHCLSNMDGHFRWAGAEPGNFAASARNVRLADDGRFLEAELRAMDGNWRWDRIHLDERIMNIDGDLQLN